METNNSSVRQLAEDYHEAIERLEYRVKRLRQARRTAIRAAIICLFAGVSNIIIFAIHITGVCTP